MYGKFTSELRDFARSQSFKMRREQAERRLEEQESKTASGGQTSGGSCAIKSCDSCATFRLWSSSVTGF